MWEIASVENYIWCILAKHSRLCNIAFSVFMIVKTINRLSNLRKVEEEKVEETKRFQGKRYFYQRLEIY